MHATLDSIEGLLARVARDLEDACDLAELLDPDEEFDARVGRLAASVRWYMTASVELLLYRLDGLLADELPASE